MSNFASQFRSISRQCLLLALVLPLSAWADNWTLQVGAQTGDKAHQALAFLPNEIWIHQGDSITWSFPSNEVHTATFLTLGQVRPSRLVGCPGGGPPDGRTPDFICRLQVRFAASRQIEFERRSVSFFQIACYDPLKLLSSLHLWFPR